MSAIKASRLKLFVVILGALVVFSTVTLATAEPMPIRADLGTGELVVRGEAKVHAEPDRAIFQVGVETEAKTVDEARKENAEKMEAIRDSLKGAGLDEKAMQTKGLNIYPEWQYDSEDGSRTLVGYRMTHMLEVTVDDLSQLGALLDGAMGAGANQVSGPTFGIANPEELEAKALASAVERAREKADVLAKAADVQIKRTVRITEQVSRQGDGGVWPALAYGVAKEASTAVSPGEVSIVAIVEITYEI